MNKPTAIILIYLSIIVAHANGQANKYDIGIEGGPGQTYLRSNGLIKLVNNKRTGYTGAFFFQYNFKKYFSIRTHIAFEQKGSLVLEQFVDLTGSNDNIVYAFYNLDYLTFPILFRASFGNRIKFILNTGPYFSYLIKQSYQSKGDKDPVENTIHNFRSKKYDAGISTGLGVLIPLKTKFAISLETRYNIGLFNIVQSPVYYYTTVKTNSINFLFGVTYRLGSRTQEKGKGEK